MCDNQRIAYVSNGSDDVTVMTPLLLAFLEVNVRFMHQVPCIVGGACNVTRTDLCGVVNLSLVTSCLYTTP
jgi:hypothetical protein